eukprot:scaffold248400_cov37-Cyclotella_meneghiniana.AAC.3
MDLGRKVVAGARKEGDGWLAMAMEEGNDRVPKALLWPWLYELCWGELLLNYCWLGYLLVLANPQSKSAPKSEKEYLGFSLW